MNKEFQFQGMTYELYTNGKVYANGIQYVEIKRGYQKSTGQWSHEYGSWKKQPGGHWFNSAVAEVAGFVKSQPAELDKILDFGKYAGKKLSEVPVSYLKWLAIHAKVLKVSNRSIVEDVKVVLNYQVEAAQKAA